MNNTLSTADSGEPSTEVQALNIDFAHEDCSGGLGIWRRVKTQTSHTSVLQRQFQRRQRGSSCLASQ